MNDLELLARDKYEGVASQITAEDRARLALGEPLAYVIGWVPFLGLSIHLDSHPLIPRPETEGWAEELTREIGNRPLRVLDLCAGSGAIGLAILSRCPRATVYFGEVSDAHADLIRKNLTVNDLDPSRAVIAVGDLLRPFPYQKFDMIATNPPYIPEARPLPESVAAFEPTEALFAGGDGLELIRRIARNAPHHLARGGEVWLEADVENIHDAATELALRGASRTTIKTDPYGRERLVLAYY